MTEKHNVQRSAERGDVLMQLPQNKKCFTKLKEGKLNVCVLYMQL